MTTASAFERMVRQVAVRITRPRVGVLSEMRDHPYGNTDSIIGVARGGYAYTSSARQPRIRINQQQEHQH